MTSRVTLYQGRPCGSIPERFWRRILATEPDILCLPEYFWVPPEARSQGDAVGFVDTAHRELERISRAIDGVVVGGSLVAEEDGQLYNTCPVWERGQPVGEQRKLSPIPLEREHGVEPGRGYRAIVAGGRRIGVMICADVLSGDHFGSMRELGVDLIVAPTLSPYRAADPAEDKQARDRDIFAAGAIRAGAPLVKVCGVGRAFGRGRIQGRSLVVDAAGRLLVRVPVRSEGRVRILAAEV